jgi:predicted small lipoprotein YifL
MRGLLFAPLLLLCACGQKGPLYLPEPAGNVIVRPAQTPSPAPADTDKAKEKKPAEPSR